MQIRKAGLTCLAALVLAAGAYSAVALGATGHGKKQGRVQTTSTSTSTTTTPRSNEDPTHEAGESAAREADEAAGKFPGGHGGPGGTFKPNEDATHEAGESAAREAQEDAGQRPSGP